MANISLFAAVPAEKWAENPTIARSFGEAMGGTAGRIAIALGIAISCLGATVTGFFGGARLIASTAQSQQLTYILASQSRKFETPVAALVFQGIITWLFTFLDDLEVLIEYFGIASWIFYLLTGVALLVLRCRQPDLERPFRVWIILPILFCILALVLVITPIFDSWLDLVGSLLAIGSGIPFWLYQEQKYLPRVQLFLRKIVRAIPGLSKPLTLPKRSCGKFQ